MIYAIDFDGTLCEHQFPYIGEPKLEVINKVREKIAQGDTFILWTCREDMELRLALKWCRKYGIRFSAVNKDLPAVMENYGYEKSVKPLVHKFVDDKNMSLEEFLKS